MEENKNIHPRPRRNVQRTEPSENNSAAGTPESKSNVQPAVTSREGQVSQPAPQKRPTPVQRPGAAKEVTSAPKPAQSAVQQSAPKPASSAAAPNVQKHPAPVQRPVSSQSAKAADQPSAKPAKQNPAQLPSERPAAKPQSVPVFDVNYAPAADNDSEKTRLTDVQPKAKLKTPVRKKVDDDGEGGSALGGIAKALIYMTAVIVVAVISAYLIIQWGNDIFAFVKSDEVVEVVIPENATVADIADILGDNDVIEYPFLFKLYSNLSGEATVDEEGNSVFIPGTYEVSPMNNYMQLLACFKARAKVREVVWVTFPEGSTVEEMITVLVDDYGIASREEFESAINDYDYGLDLLEGVDEIEGRYYRLEGYLFPDTYQFYTDSTAETVVYKMLTNFESKLEYLSYGDKTYKDRLGELGMTLDEVVTLASMIEEEVKYPIDYDQVSSVFHNRLKDPVNYAMLGSDATTIYAITMETGERPQSLGAEELAFDSPYNTRKSQGLPPGAIANPGFEALYSAFYPADTKYYYFVADEYGYNLYARTEAGHEKNKASIND